MCIILFRWSYDEITNLDRQENIFVIVRFEPYN